MLGGGVVRNKEYLGGIRHMARQKTMETGRGHVKVNNVGGGKGEVRRQRQQSINQVSSLERKMMTHATDSEEGEAGGGIRESTRTP